MYGFVLSFVVILATPLVFCAPTDAGLYALYRFEDASGAIGATIADSTSNGYDGEVLNAPIGFGSSPLPGQSGDFSGTNGIVSADLPGIGSTLGDFAIALWMKSADTNQNQIYLTDRHPVGGGNQLAVIYEYADDQIELFAGGLGGPNPRPGSQIAMSDTDWHHIVYSRTGTEYAYYLDGARTDIGTLTGDITGLVERLNIGAARSSDSVNAFNGQLDDVAWFDNGLTQAQVGNIITGDFSEFGVPEPSTLLLTSWTLLTIACCRRRR
jgi:hypothetical protein